jgi:hypothetical protein
VGAGGCHLKKIGVGVMAQNSVTLFKQIPHHKWHFSK